MKNFHVFFYVYKASEGKCWQARGVRFTLCHCASLNTRLHSPGKRHRKETTPVLHVFFFLFFDLTAADISVSSQGTKNLSFSNNLLIFPEEHADMHV